MPSLTLSTYLAERHPISGRDDALVAHMRQQLAASGIPAAPRWAEVRDAVDSHELPAASRLWAAYEHHVALVAGRFEEAAA